MRVRDERGQVLVLTTLLLTGLLGVCAMVLDAGVWFQTDRQAQATADAAALAGAQVVRDSEADAYDLAQEYAAKNGGAGAQLDIATTNEAITVEVARSAPGYFSRIVGIESVAVNARATARATPVGTVRWAAPIAVSESDVQCVPGCFGDPVRVGLRSTGAPGAFGWIDLDRGWAAGNDELADWIAHGYDGTTGLGSYPSVPGMRLASDTRDALASRVGSELVLPVYRSINGSGRNATYNVVAWAGFRVSEFDGRNTLEGWFTSLTWDGEASANTPDYGVRTVELVE